MDLQKSSELDFGRFPEHSNITIFALVVFMACISSARKIAFPMNLGFSYLAPMNLLGQSL